MTNKDGPTICNHLSAKANESLPPTSLGKCPGKQKAPHYFQHIPFTSCIKLDLSEQILAISLHPALNSLSNCGLVWDPKGFLSPNNGPREDWGAGERYAIHL